MSESITDRVEAVRVLGALPVPAGSKPQPLSDDRLAEIRNRNLDEVTPGPWLVADGSGGRPVVYIEAPLDGVVGARVLLAAEGASEADVQFVASARRSVPELAAEVVRLRAQVAALLAERHETNEFLDDAVQALRARNAADGAEVFVPRTERSRWVDIAAALNAAHDAGMPVGIDLDGTLTDRHMWSVVWDRESERWTVAGYEDTAAPCCHLHKPSCCDPEDCGPCCMDCPTCPVLAKQRAL